jgi:hypothetical protein
VIVENNPEPVDDLRPFGTIMLLFETEAERRQAEVFVEALAKYAERNAHYHDNWRRMGYRGMLVRVRERAERLWDALFWSDGPTTDYTLWSEARLDDAIDLINFAGFLVRAVRAANRDGNWWHQP